LLYFQVKSLQTWAEQVLAEMNQDEPVRNVAGAKDKQQRHIELKAEIDARADTYTTLAESGRAMIKNGHFAASDVRVSFL
jgi:spectrin beta